MDIVRPKKGVDHRQRSAPCIDQHLSVRMVDSAYRHDGNIQFGDRIEVQGQGGMDRIRFRDGGVCTAECNVVSPFILCLDRAFE